MFIFFIEKKYNYKYKTTLEFDRRVKIPRKKNENNSALIFWKKNHLHALHTLNISTNI
jgi:hypothetical protein